MKKYVLVMVLAVSSFAHADIDLGDVLKRATKVNCNASYSMSLTGVRGTRTGTEVVNIKARTATEACIQAQGQSRRWRGVYGPNSKTLSSLVCTDVLGRSQFIDVGTCR